MVTEHKINVHKYNGRKTVQMLDKNDFILLYDLTHLKIYKKSFIYRCSPKLQRCLVSFSPQFVMHPGLTEFFKAAVD